MLFGQVGASTHLTKNSKRKTDCFPSGIFLYQPGRKPPLAAGKGSKSAEGIRSALRSGDSCMVIVSPAGVGLVERLSTVKGLNRHDHCKIFK